MLIASQLLNKLRQRPLRSALTDDQRAWKNIELLAGSASLAKLIDSLNSKITREGEEGSKAFKEYVEWCRELSARVSHA